MCASLNQLKRNYNYLVSKLDVNFNKTIVLEYELQWSQRQTVEKVIVFDLESQSTMCYEFVPYRDNRYRCLGCLEDDNLSELKLFENEVGHFYAKMGTLNHSCQPVKYVKKEMDSEMV